MSTGESGNPLSNDDSVIAAYSAGQPVPEIAAQHQISPEAVYEIVHKMATAPANFCSACGAALPAAAGFCPQCGNPVAGVAGPGAAERPVAMWAVLAAGILAILGSFLPWAVISAPIIGTISKSGVDGSDGWVSIVLGALLAAYAAVRLSPRHLPGTVTALAGLVAALLIGLAIVEFVDLRSKADDMRSTMADHDDPLGIGAAISNAVQVKPGLGLWLVAAAGLVGAIALLIAVTGRGGPGKVAGAAGAAVLVAGVLAAAVVTMREQDTTTSPNVVMAASTAKGVVTPVDPPRTIDLADDHYLKLGFAVQFSDDVTTQPDLDAARTAALDTYTGRPIAAVESKDGRAQLKSEFLARLREAYPGTVLDVYYTTFVTQ
ncbi:hypothetical protein GCM10010112_65940 [Actinoplanes lobatus]|uniref:Flagellar protein FliL n=1 Tax=Actinoplanes lobatus TaxID=113568 RepID=A0A7W7HK19_9ACTN|nr:flagellar basal body-associated FliL family protein [Actinoplanes lobatus]MBB4751930.1 flagellar basal body-associated protein FliL [Actinoplanes lobatus]GGN85480.1 hypothetical protein GCM10010112_65940 [Actinoplanes lobatus]GIE44343.1 hypothetical protein Alo02nite_72410 [Actinoplanes lobatus]